MRSNAFGMSRRGLTHVLFSPRAEGCPRLALDLIDQEMLNRGSLADVAFCVSLPDDLLHTFRDRVGRVGFLHWRPKGFLPLAAAAYSFLRAVRPSGVVCYTIGHHVPIAAAARLLRIPAVVHVGCRAPPEAALARKFRWIMQAGAPLVRAHIACSDAVARDCRDVYGLRNVVVVPNGIDIKRFAEVRKSLQLVVGPQTPPEQRAMRVGMIASLEASKDHAVLIDAIALLRARGENVRLVLAGSGSHEDALRARASQAGLSAVDWLGTVSDVREVLASLDVFAFAATPSEGFGISLVEALAAGVPVVASDVPAFREVLESGRLGQLVSPRDPQAWADVLTKVLEAGRGAHVAPLDEIERFDIRNTWLGYVQALGQA